MSEQQPEATEVVEDATEHGNAEWSDGTALPGDEADTDVSGADDAAAPSAADPDHEAEAEEHVEDAPAEEPAADGAVE